MSRNATGWWPHAGTRCEAWDCVHRRFYPAVIRIRQLIASGAIGQPVFAQMIASEPFDPAPGDPRHWLVQPSQSGGGPMADFGCHRIEVLLRLLGPTADVRSVVTERCARPGSGGHAATLRWFEVARARSSRSPHAAADRRDTLEILGSRGSHSRGIAECRRLHRCGLARRSASNRIRPPRMSTFRSSRSSWTRVRNRSRSGGRRPRRPMRSPSYRKPSMLTRRRFVEALGACGRRCRTQWPCAPHKRHRLLPARQLRVTTPPRDFGPQRGADHLLTVIRTS